MYNKVIELCEALHKLTNDELEANGISAIMIFGLDNNFNSFELTKGSLPDIMAILGSALTTVSKKSDIPLKALLCEIYDTEIKLEQYRKEGD